MLIGELSSISGLSRDTIRWYEKIGLIKNECTSRDHNNYRVYDDEALHQLMLIKQSKFFGFSLKEIREMLTLVELENLTCNSLQPLIDSKLNSIDQKIQQLQTARDHLQTLQRECSGDCQSEIVDYASRCLKDL